MLLGALAGAALAAFPAALPATAGDGLPEGARVQTYKSGLEMPVDMARVPGSKRIFFTQKNGAVRVLRGRHETATRCTKLRVNEGGEMGAAGIALDPDFDQNAWLYVYFTSSAHDDNRIARFEVVDDLCTNKEIIFDGIDAATIHNGGQLEFLDGYLYVSTGDAARPAAAQDPQDLSGKILRLNPDGSVPAGNPFSEVGAPNPVWSLGHRNPYGLAARRGASQLFESENGPTCDDEVNLIVEGANYGWGANDASIQPGYQYPCKASQPTEPLWDWTPTIAPTDMTWYRGAVDAVDGTLLMADYLEGDIHSFDVAEDGQSVVEGGYSVFYDGEEPIFDVARGPRGWVYFLTPDSINRIVEVSGP